MRSPKFWTTQPWRWCAAKSIRRVNRREPPKRTCTKSDLSSVRSGIIPRMEMRSFVFFAAIAPLMFGQDSTMLQADGAFTMAIATANRAALEKLLDADFTWTNAGGKVLSRTQVLAKLPQTAIAEA